MFTMTVSMTFKCISFQLGENTLESCCSPVNVPLWEFSLTHEQNFKFGYLHLCHWVGVCSLNWEAKVLHVYFIYLSIYLCFWFLDQKDMEWSFQGKMNRKDYDEWWWSSSLHTSSSSLSSGWKWVQSDRLVKVAPSSPGTTLTMTNSHKKGESRNLDLDGHHHNHHPHHRPHQHQSHHWYHSKTYGTPLTMTNSHKKGESRNLDVGGHHHSQH